MHAYKVQRQRMWSGQAQAALQRTHYDANPSGRYVTYLVKEGLANRLKSHLFASKVAMETGRILAPVWRPTVECSAVFSDLFHQEQDASWRYSQKFLVKYDPIKMVTNWEFGRDGDRPEDLIVLDLSWQYMKIHALVEQLGGPVAFADFAQRQLQPRPQIAERIEAKSAAWPEQMIGVQIRRGDFIKFGQAIELDRYIDATRRALTAYPQAGVFLSSDGSPEELAPFLSQFSKHLDFEKPEQRTQKEGVQDALVDFLLLSKCSRLVMTPLSSFGELAAKIRNVECVWA